MYVCDDVSGFMCLFCLLEYLAEDFEFQFCSGARRLPNMSYLLGAHTRKVSLCLGQYWSHAVETSILITFGNFCSSSLDNELNLNSANAFEL